MSEKISGPLGDLVNGAFVNEGDAEVIESKKPVRHKVVKKTLDTKKQKTSLYLPEELFWNLKQHCALKRINMTRFMEDAVCEKIKREKRRSQDTKEN